MKLAGFSGIANKDIATAIQVLNAKFEIESKWNVTVVTIEPEDGSGKKYLVTTKQNPGKRQFVDLNNL